MVKLDIGCGGNPKGDVNLDLFYDESPHTVKKIEAKHIPNFVLGSARYLPFRGRCFDESVVSHLLEHVPVPTEVLGEIGRVTKDRVLIAVPNNPLITEHREHLYSWSKTSLGNLLRKFFSEVDIRLYTDRADIEASRLFRLIRRFPPFRYPIQRFLSRKLGLVLIADCRGPI